MSGTNGNVAPNGEAAPGAELPDDAIDATLEEASQQVDTQEHRLSGEVAELKAHARAQQEMMAEMRSTMTRLNEQNEELVGRSRSAADRGWQMTVGDVRARMHKAASDADMEAFKAAEHDLFRLMDEGPPGTKTKQPNQQGDEGKPAAQKQPTAPDPVVTAWTADNAWVNDKKLWREASAIEVNILEDKPHLSTADRLKEVTAEMAKRHPQKFANTNRQTPQAVSRPGPQAAKPKAKEATLADLDDDAKAGLAAIQRIDPNFKAETYLKGYKQREARQKEIGRL